VHTTASASTTTPASSQGFRDFSETGMRAIPDDETAILAAKRSEGNARCRCQACFVVCPRPGACRLEGGWWATRCHHCQDSNPSANITSSQPPGNSAFSQTFPQMSAGSVGSPVATTKYWPVGTLESTMIISPGQAAAIGCVTIPHGAGIRRNDAGKSALTLMMPLAGLEGTWKLNTT